MNKNHNHCKNEDADYCILFSACQDCYYFESQLVCPFCNRIIPSSDFKRGPGCPWCQQIGVKNEN
jgi:hypothetical protein